MASYSVVSTLQQHPRFAASPNPKLSSKDKHDEKNGVDSNTLHENNSLPPKIGGWETILSFGGKRPIFRGELLVLGRVFD